MRPNAKKESVSHKQVVQHTRSIILCPHLNSESISCFKTHFLAVSIITYSTAQVANISTQILQKSEHWVLMIRMISRLRTTEMKYLRRIKGVTRMNRLRNEEIRKLFD